MHMVIAVYYCKVLGEVKHNGPEGITTKKGQHSQAFFALAGLTKPNTLVRDNRYHNYGYHLSLFGRLACHLTRLPHKMDWLCAAYFSEEEQVVIMESYEEYLKKKKKKSQ